MKRGEVWWATGDNQRPVVLGRSEGLPRDCVLNCDWLVTIAKTDLVERAGALSEAKLRKLDEALRFALALD